MTNEAKAVKSGWEDELSTRQVWFFGGVGISFAATLCLLVLLSLLAALITFHNYLDWSVPGFEAPVSSSESRPDGMAKLVPVHFLVVTPTQTPILTLGSAPTPLPTIAPLQEQVVAGAGLVGKVAGAGLRDSITVQPLHQAIPGVMRPTLRIAVTGDTPQGLAVSLARQLASFSVPMITVEPPVMPTQISAVSPESVPLANSANLYALIPLEGQRESRAAADHGDLNLKLRNPQPIAVDLNLVDINGSGLDPDAPNLAAIFKPDFVRAYTVHDWDWSCNCQGKLFQEEHVVLVGIRTTPGAPVFVPPRRQNVYAGKYYATVLYASEDSLTFVYTRAGSVATGYTVHYLGLQTDPNLLALFRQSRGSELPGLTLNTPVGIATAELIVAIRDNGTFLDARSRRDWWE